MKLDTPFCIEDQFYSDITGFMEDNDLLEKEAIDELPDDWVQKIEYCTPEKMFLIREGDAEHFAEVLFNLHEDRYPEDDRTDDIVKALVAGMDLEKINSLIPELWYPNGEKGLITKQDLLTEAI